MMKRKRTVDVVISTWSNLKFAELKKRKKKNNRLSEARVDGSSAFAGRAAEEYLWKWFYDRDITGIPREGDPTS